MPLRASLGKAIKKGLLSVGYPTSQLKETDATIVLFYHAIGDAGVPLIEFEKQLDYLSSHFELVFASEVCHPASSNGLRVAITFDDGLRNTREAALPLLEKYGARATIFVLPCVVPWLWPAEIRERLSGALRSGVDLDVTKESDVDRIVNDLKSMSQAAFQARIDQIRAVTSFDPSSSWLAAHELMSADELRSLPEDLIEFGAHTIHHPILPSLDHKSLEREIVDVKGQLETMLERPIKTFSYPNGDFDNRSLDLVQQHYDAAFSTETAIGAHRDQDNLRGNRYLINRLHGVDRAADLPLKMYQFINQGHGFTMDGGDGLANGSLHAEQEPATQETVKIEG